MVRARIILFAIGAATLVAGPACAWNTYNEISAGYYSGASVFGSVGIENFIENVPLGLELGIGYSFVDAGDAVMARRVFINQNTNGSPQSDGSQVDLLLNFVYGMNVLPEPFKFYVYGGPRYAHYDAHFRYIDGNEEFDVVTDPFGLGLGARAVAPIGRSRVSAFASFGIDYYFPDTIEGHDTTYNPNNQNINPKENFQYSDARNTVRPPNIEPRFMVGLQF